MSQTMLVDCYSVTVVVKLFCRTIWYSIKIKHYVHGHSCHEFVSNYDLPYELQIIECIWLLFPLKVPMGFISVSICYHYHYCLHSVKISLLVITSSQRSLRYIIATLKPDENDGHSAGGRIPFYSIFLLQSQHWQEFIPIIRHGMKFFIGSRVWELDE